MEQITSECLHLFKSCSSAGSLNLGTIGVWGQALFAVGPVLCAVGCLTESLVPTC